MAAVEVPHAGRARDTTQDLYAQYGKQIYSYCLHKLRSREEAEDAVQTTFLNAFRSLQRGAQTQFEQAWLYKIAQNVCVARQTSSSRRLRLEAPNDFEVLQEVVPSREGEQPLELIGIEEALERMPENQRRAILLREWQGLSYREISEELGLSQAAVEMLIFRARRSLAGALEQPEEERKRGRAARRVGSLGASFAGVMKTLLGGGAAIKAVTLAAAAVTVVGEAAHHTVVTQTRAVKPKAASATIAALGDRPSRLQQGARPSSPVVRVVAHRQVTRARHVVAASVTSHVVRARPDVEPTPAVHVAPAASAPEPAPAPAPEPAPAVAAPPPPAVVTVTPEVAVAPPPAAPPAPAPAPVEPTPPADLPGNAYGHDKADPPAAPATPTPDPAPAADTSGNGNGNGHAYGQTNDAGAAPGNSGNAHDKQK